MDERAEPEESELIATRGVACQTSAAPEASATRLPSRALVVDDSLVVADVVTALLRRTGWTVDVATSVDRALEHVHGVPYDLVVCDVCMIPRWVDVSALRKAAGSASWRRFCVSSSR